MHDAAGVYDMPLVGYMLKIVSARLMGESRRRFSFH